MRLCSQITAIKGAVNDFEERWLTVDFPGRQTLSFGNEAQKATIFLACDWPKHERGGYFRKTQYWPNTQSNLLYHSDCRATTALLPQALRHLIF